MADGYWNRRQPNPPMLSSGGMLKRPRTDYDVTGFPAGYHRCPAALLCLSEPETSSASTNAPPSGPRSALEMPSYLARDDDHGGHLSVRDTKSIGSAYDRYLQSAIFRPFVGYKEVRLVSKEPRQRGGDPIVLCFVDFSSPACAATAMSALQGYKMDEHDPDSNYLKLQFSRYPGPRSGPGTRGRFIKLLLKKLSSFTSGEASAFGGSGRAVGGAMPVHPIADPPLMGRLGSAAPDLSSNGHNIGYSGQHPVDAIARPGRDTVPLPPDASNTLYVEGFPPNSTRREVARILDGT
ncbi:hypothetical protein GOBAR_DD02328 [Gossypium barbadense]|nr:hypothetical protein GOBAR_DD02328 [Gossypium barbadense]